MKWKTSIDNSRSFPSADVGSDHQLVIANLRLRFKTKARPNYPKRYDVQKLKDTITQNSYEVEIGGRFSPLLYNNDTDVETQWDGIKTAFNETSKKVLGNRKAQHQDPWISEEVLQLSDERKQVKIER
ncbi:craniofacial development protein 2-like [Amphiura filiformis]|uniref:craniofacial development protein 2-like n=1 Tax=Amphiura filiformis TaxID=82378 RepID=UPI003B2146BC